MSRTVMARQVRCALVLGWLFSTVASARPALAQPAPAPAVPAPAAAEAPAPPRSEHVEPRHPAALLTGKAGGLTATQVAEHAVATSFVAEQRRHEVEVAVANLNRALYDFMPRLSGQVSYFRLSEVEEGRVNG